MVTIKATSCQQFPNERFQKLPKVAKISQKLPPKVGVGGSSFFLLNEYFYELNPRKNPVLNIVFELNPRKKTVLNIFLH